MSTALQPAQAIAEATPDVYRITVDQLHCMLANGVIQDGERVELIGGMLVYKDRRDEGGEIMSHGDKHARGIRRLSRLSIKLLPLGYECQIQLPVTLADHSEPEPDAAIVRVDESVVGHPKPQDISVVFEVSYSSLRLDRTVKMSMYAAAEIPVYCIVNMKEDVLEVYNDPDATTRNYKSQQVLTSDATLSLVLRGGEVLGIDAVDLLPPN